MRNPRDPYTYDLFKDYQPPRVSVGYEPGAIKGTRLASRISRAVARAMKESGKDRTTIAGLMSEKLGRRVTVTTLEADASEAKTGNQITLERFIALIQATGRTELLGFVAEPFDLVVIPKRYENVIELALIEDQQKMIESRRRLLQAQLRRGA
ncbi:hypothetical protein [Polymorphum gilvum]|uniref:Uncharacterized protein n=1 Tax=Polymorphum gilvum (strain LMG 25793 / CGMCC 1.9160 / SL003B-26A1) TaxID=991905 RepID=F2J545_POLGS|nr:hypothetical protein [Polymorphum gilvum]ADZ70087.1 hypothetical protein SL003B_1659 [Polymorphum gilvum SL003B-26A1]